MPETKPNGTSAKAGRDSAGCVAFTAEIDRLICERFLGSPQPKLQQLGDAGLTEEAIEKRARALGLSDSFRAQCEAAGARAAVRECLGCEQVFVSLGPQNRMCRRCRSRS